MGDCIPNSSRRPAVVLPRAIGAETAILRGGIPVSSFLTVRACR